jgi:hypothetical protein
VGREQLVAAECAGGHERAHFGVVLQAPRVLLVAHALPFRERVRHHIAAACGSLHYSRNEEQ